MPFVTLSQLCRLPETVLVLGEEISFTAVIPKTVVMAKARHS